MCMAPPPPIPRYPHPPRQWTSSKITTTTRVPDVPPKKSPDPETPAPPPTPIPNTDRFE